jgi:hypothetical protein
MLMLGNNLNRASAPEGRFESGGRVMLRKLALATAVCLSVAALPAAAIAAHGGGGGHGGGGFGGGGHGGFGGHSFSGGGFGGRSFSPGFAPRGIPGGGISGRNAFVNRGVPAQPFANRGMTAQAFMSRSLPVGPMAGRHVTANGRFAWDGHHRIHGRHIHGFIPGFGYGYYWYYGDCWAWSDYGWINVCVDGDYY